MILVTKTSDQARQRGHTLSTCSLQLFLLECVCVCVCVCACVCVCVCVCFGVLHCLYFPSTALTINSSFVVRYLHENGYETSYSGYQFKVGAYVQVNCPAISAYDWHPFSLFPVPGSKPRAGFHVEAVSRAPLPSWTM